MPSKVPHSFKLIPIKRDIDPRLIERSQKRMEWLIGFMIVRYRFVHHILSMMNKICLPGMGTMGVNVPGGGKFNLFYDPEFVDKLKDEYLTYVFYHEIMHTVLHHCTRRQFDNKDIGNMAHDLAVNELIPVNASSCEPPRDEKGKLIGCHVCELKKMPKYKDIKEMQTAEWYYDYLMQKAKQQGGGGEGEGQSGNGLDRHDGWKEDEVSDERIKAKIAEIDASDQWGDVSAGAKEMVRAAQTKRINWRNRIRTFIGNMLWKYRQLTRKRPNRRTGYLFCGSKRVHVDRYLVATDTSGSVYTDLLAQFLDVINSLLEFCPIDLMQFDADKTSGPEPFNRKRVDYEFTGRGGTNFQPVIDAADKGHYRGLVILTDGCADVCTKPKTAHVLWVLPKGCNPPVPWGERVYMERHV